MSNQKPRFNRTHRGIFLLPNLFTTGAIFAGFYAIIVASHHQFEQAAIAIFIAMLLDGLDGRVARLTHSQSKFGAEYDSLSDMVSFGLAPALVLYNWSLVYMNKAGWLVAFLYAVCSALRLARFNSQSQNTNKRYFYGLSTTAAAGFIAGLIWVAHTYQIAGDEIWVRYGVIVIASMVALLKVSFIPYRSFKDVDIRGRVPFLMSLVFVLLLVLVSAAPAVTLFVIFGIYAFSGPVGWLWRSIRRKKVSA
jgi:CDP-diacylglycerol--serine O-phosphatidyltransferase